MCIRDSRYGAAVTAPSANDLSRAGYAFGGWYTDKSCSSENEFTAATMPAECIGGLVGYAKGSVTLTLPLIHISPTAQRIPSRYICPMEQLPPLHRQLLRFPLPIFPRLR